MIPHQTQSARRAETREHLKALRAARRIVASRPQYRALPPPTPPQEHCETGAVEEIDPHPPEGSFAKVVFEETG